MDKPLTIQPHELDQAIVTWVQELAPGGICITDNQLRIQAWNWWLETKSGLSKEEVVGRKLLEVFPDLETRKLHVHFQKAVEGEVSVLSVAFHKFLFAFPPTVQIPGYSNMRQTARIAPLIRDGKIIGTITTVEDVTEREYQHAVLRKQHERRALFSWALACLLQSTNPEVMVREIFPRISAHLEVDVYAHYLVGPNGKLNLHSAGGISPAIQEKFATMDFGENMTGACAAQRQSIVTFHVQQSDDPKMQRVKELGIRSSICHPLLVGSKLIGTLSLASRQRDQFDPEEVEFTRIVAQYIAIALERTRTLKELHDARTELQNYAGSLESKVAQRTVELEKSFKALESFSYTLAHDVRAPLRHIRGFADALQEDCGAELSEQASGYVKSILRAIHKLDALTHDILAYGQLTQRPSAKIAVDLESLIGEIVANHPGLRTSDTVTIKHPLHKPLAEPFLIEQCMTNLLDNALKFVPANVTPRITVSTESKQDWVRISVEDNGIGVPPEFHGKIFGIFERLSTKDNYQGTGIGLAIVAKATEQMDGRFGVESLSTGGSRFWIELPAA